MALRFTTLTTRFAGTCKRCGERFPAGTRIRFGGRGRTYHFAAECPTGTRPLATEMELPQSAGAAALEAALGAETREEAMLGW
jgi:hypothetical protein